MKKIQNSFAVFLQKIELPDPVEFRKSILSAYGLASFFYVFMEWFFFATKSSFMDNYDFFEKIQVLLTTFFVVNLAGLLCVLVIAWVYKISSRTKVKWIIALLACAFPAFFLSITTLILVDNFVYTIFKWGIVYTQGIIRGAYGLIFVLAFLYYCKLYLTALFIKVKKASLIRGNYWLFIGVLSLSFIVTIKNISLLQVTSITSTLNTNKNTYPNILLIGSDGLAADHMSVYGYERDTTPFLREFAKSSLIGLNAFTNNGDTSGSIISIYTGKLPTQTRVVYPPNSLMDIDQYQHFPGILNSLGYYSEQLTVSYYADANSTGVLNGFDKVNKQSPVSDRIAKLTQVVPVNYCNYFLYTIATRISDRLLHIFFIKTMANPFDEVNQRSVTISDEYRANQIIKVFRNIDDPIFMHVHFMGTHGPTFHFEHPFFSEGKDQNTGWMTDFYDDSILAFDSYLSQVITGLDGLHKLDNTIVIIYTDHYQQWETKKRIPLIIRFPGGQNAGIIEENIQNLDIAPTIMEYLEQPIPNWMGGQSVFQLMDNPNPYRIIFSTVEFGKVENEDTDRHKLNANLTAPFYQFRYLQAVVCDEYYRLNLRDLSWENGKIIPYEGSCDHPGRPSQVQIKQAIVNQLVIDGFNLSSIDVEHLIQEVVTEVQ